MKAPIPRPLGGHTGQPPLRVAVYCRTPSEFQEEHRAYYTEKVEQNSGWTMAGFFLDIKSRDAKRPEFDRMLRLCKQRKFDLVLTRSATQFARSTVDCLTIIRTLRDLGVSVIFEREGFDTRDPNSDFITALIATFAEAERSSIPHNSVHTRYMGFHIKRQNNERRNPK